MAEELEGSENGVGKDARTWAMICHISALSGYFIPFGNILAPLIIWAIKKDESPFIDQQGKEAINFQLTMTIAIIISAILTLIVIGIFLLIAIAIYMLVMIVIAAIKTNDGVDFQYPYCIRFLK